jgi:hypothetical protein
MTQSGQSPMSELESIADTARDLAYRQIDAQLQASDNFDTKALGVLGFDGAALAAVLATRDAFHGGWFVPGLLLLISGAFAVLVMQRSAWDLGPDPRAFYDSEVGRGIGIGSAARSNVDLVSEFGGPRGSIAMNQAVLTRKAWFFAWSIAATLFAGIVGAILVALA